MRLDIDLNKKSIPNMGSFPLANKTKTLFMKMPKQHNLLFLYQNNKKIYLFLNYLQAKKMIF